MVFQYSAFADESGNEFSAQVDALKRNRYQYLEIRNVDGQKLTDVTLPQAKEMAGILADNGLSVWSMGSPIGKMQVDGDWNGHLDQYRHVLDMAGIFGARHIRLFSFFMPRGEDPTQYRSLVMDRMHVFAEIAKAYGVICCHENEKGIYGDIASRCLEIHQEVPEIKAVFDPANFVQCGQDTLQAWDQLCGYVEYMHIKDALPDGRVVPPGQGHGNVPALIQKYAAQGGKVLSLEPHLTKFVGLSALEQEGDTSVIGTVSFASKEAAFDFAANNLYKIVESLA